MANKPIVIAFSGGCFSGKTTTMEKLKETLEARGHRVTMLSELVREHKIESIDKLRENPSKYLAFQNEIISAKIEAENACKSTDTDVILIDRAITDSMFYLLFYVDKNKLSFKDITLFYGLFGRIKTHMLRAWHEIYDLIIEFEPISKPCDDTVYRPKQIGTLKYLESSVISMLNDFTNSGALNRWIGWDLNIEPVEQLILNVINRFKL